MGEGGPEGGGPERVVGQEVEVLGQGGNRAWGQGGEACQGEGQSESARGGLGWGARWGKGGSRGQNKDAELCNPISMSTPTPEEVKTEFQRRLGPRRWRPYSTRDLYLSFCFFLLLSFLIQLSKKAKKDIKEVLKM